MAQGKRVRKCGERKPTDGPPLTHMATGQQRIVKTQRVKNNKKKQNKTKHNSNNNNNNKTNTDSVPTTRVSVKNGSTRSLLQSLIWLIEPDRALVNPIKTPKTSNEPSTLKPKSNVSHYSDYTDDKSEAKTRVQKIRRPFYWFLLFFAVVFFLRARTKGKTKGQK